MVAGYEIVFRVIGHGGIVINNNYKSDGEGRAKTEFSSKTD